MSAKESRGPSVGTHTKPSGHGRRGLPTGRPSRIVGSSETAVRFARSPVAQSVERLTVNQEVAGSSPARGANYFEHLLPPLHAVGGGKSGGKCTPAPSHHPVQVLLVSARHKVRVVQQGRSRLGVPELVGHIE